jgi:hypothetical protein
MNKWIKKDILNIYQLFKRKSKTETNELNISMQIKVTWFLQYKETCGIIEVTSSYNLFT